MPCVERAIYHDVYLVSVTIEILNPNLKSKLKIEIWDSKSKIQNMKSKIEILNLNFCFRKSLYTIPIWLIEKIKKAPAVGLEPTTTSLKGWRSTDWAMQAAYLLSRNNVEKGVVEF